MTGLSICAVLRIGLPTTFIVTPATALTGVITTLVAKPIGLVTMLAQLLAKEVPPNSIKTNKTSLLMALTSSNQLAFANKFSYSFDLFLILITQKFSADDRKFFLTFLTPLDCRPNWMGDQLLGD